VPNIFNNLPDLTQAISTDPNFARWWNWQ